MWQRGSVWLVLPSALVTWLAGTPAHASADRAAAIDVPSRNVRVAGGRLTLDVESEPLARILRAVAQPAGVTITFVGRVDRPVTASFADVPLEEGLRRILPTESVAFVYAGRA